MKYGAVIAVVLVAYLVVPTTSQELDVDVYQLHIRSDVTFRFATTRVSSRVQNRVNSSREVSFYIVLPPSAFISNFSMFMNGELFFGKVKPRKVASREYEAAKERGESAGQISQEKLNSNEFLVTVNVAALAQVDFNVTYEQLLQRRRGLYELLVNINPGQVVPDLRLLVYINESREISDLRVPPMREIVNSFQLTHPGDNPLVRVERPGPRDALITFQPTVEEQLADTDLGVNGQFIVQYDVMRDEQAGEIQVVDGYFVHYFAPPGLEPEDKDIQFIIDTSGSMSGEKLRQTKESLLEILDDLRPGDRFSIINFGSSVYVWPSEETPLLRATEENKIQARSRVQQLNAGGGTNIHSALTTGIRLFVEAPSGPSGVSRPRLVVFLTDGNANEGISNVNTIVDNIRNLNQDRVSLFALGFGMNLNFEFLQKLSLQNNGFARRIYTGTNARIQLEGFYDEIATPLLSDVSIRYLGDSVVMDTVTATHFNTLFEGAELVVAGKLESNATSLPLEVTAGGNFSLAVNIQRSDAERRSRELDLVKFTERLWAYLTIRRLLDAMVQAVDSNVRAEAEERATAMSLQYGFVTPLTSMVITKPRPPVPQQDSETPSRSLPSSDTRARSPASSGSFVDNDPHFVILMKGIGESVCFDVTGPPGSVYQLVHDKVTDITVNARLVSPPKDQNRTYLGEIVLRSGKHVVRVTPHNITVRHRVLRWGARREFDRPGLLVSILNKRHIDVTFNNDVTFRIRRHLVKVPNPDKVDFLGFYVSDGSGLSRRTHGLIGQFQHQTAAMLTPPYLDVELGHFVSRMRFNGPHGGQRDVTAFLDHRRNMQDHHHVSCWMVGEYGRGLLHGSYHDYRVPDVTYKGISRGIGRIKTAGKFARRMFSSKN